MRVPTITPAGPSRTCWGVVADTRKQPTPIRTPLTLAKEQLDRALNERTESSGAYPAPPWQNLADLTGTIPPGHLWVIGARPAMGKTTFLLNIVNAWCLEGLDAEGWQPGDEPWPGRVLYICTETDATELRSLWAALRLGFDADEILENNFAKASPILSETEAFERFTREMVKLSAPDLAQSVVFYQVPHMDGNSLGPVLRDWGLKQGRGTIILDHINRWQSSDPGKLTAELTDAVRSLKGWVSEKRIRLFAAAQINPLPKHQRSVLSDFLPPTLADLKQTQALAEEANVVIGLHQAKRADATAKDIKAAIEGRVEASTLLESDVMCATILKARKRRRKALGRTVRLQVGSDGRLTDPAAAHRAEREPGEESDQGGLPF